MLGAQWAYENEDLQSGNTYDLHCTISELFEWPDQQPGSTRACMQNGTALLDARYALYPNRIERRENGMFVYEPPVDAFRVPLDVGDTWETEFRFAGMSPVIETWAVIAAEPIELAFGTFDAVEVEYTSNSAAGTGVTTAWWVDGIGTVKSVTETTRLELVSFSLP
ncbi:MAG: hypothetical protein IAG13_01330 [Deltaproteobacteria bacterium]|nr:hypothetical protein [Nannocystaceae bacterium]